ncbi:MAG: TlpA family protein disulfide reductase [Coriobacteriales bacterium]|jgi:thiol-disulfide isomerase/thioredoxin|nr:TlpA family protein disulfide reductase [Coriobacteriales bacterium]
MKIKKMLRMGAVLLAALLSVAVLTACEGGAASEGTPAPNATVENGTSAPASNAVVKEGASAPDFSYVTTDEESGSLSELKGKVVLLNLWASWCGPCVKEMPALAELKKDYPELEVLTVNVSDDPASARAFISDAGYDFRWVIDEKGTISARYPADGIPYTIIIDRDGVVSSLFLGSPPNTYAAYEKAIKKAGL